jgi:hypothetical protein
MSWKLMADYCQQCSLKYFDEDFKDMAGLGKGEDVALKEGWGYSVLCEGCGPTLVDDEGKCMGCDRHQVVSELEGK